MSIAASSVFVVDDDPSMRTSLCRLLREHGFAATLFESANALRDQGNFEEAICIVLDINLDGQSGIDLRRQLTEQGIDRAESSTSPATTARQIKPRRFASGCVAYLTKPFSARSLIDSIERAAAGLTGRAADHSSTYCSSVLAGAPL